MLKPKSPIPLETEMHHLVNHLAQERQAGRNNIQNKTKDAEVS